MRIRLIDRSIGLISKSNLVKNSLIYTISNFVNASVNFLLIPVLTRYLSPEEYGIVAMFVIVQLFVLPFVGCNVHGAITRRYHYNNGSDLAEYVGNCFYILLGSSVVTFLIVLMFGSGISRYTAIPLDWLFVILVSCFFQFVFLIPLTIWQVKLKPMQYGAFQILQTLANLGISLILVITFKYGWKGRVLGQVASMGLFSVVTIFILLKNKWINFKYDKVLFLSALRFGVPLIPHTIGAVIIMLTDRLLLNNIVGLKQTGIYMVAFQCASVLNLGTTALNSAYVPWLYSKLKLKDEVLNRKIVKFTYLYFVLLIMVTSAIIIISPYLFPIVIGDKFIGASKYFSIIILGFMFNGFYLMVTNYLFYVEKTEVLGLSTIFLTIINLPLSYFLIKHFDAIGAAYGFVIISFLTFIFTFYFSQKYYKMPWLKRKVNT